jgi:hypothetical protein
VARKNRFAAVDSVRIDMGDGDWIEIKRELTAGERLDTIRAGMMGTSIASDGVRAHHDSILVRKARVCAWLIDWNYVGADDKVISIAKDGDRRAALDNLKAPEFYAIEDAIAEHEKSLEAAAAPADGEGNQPASDGGGGSSGGSSVSPS